MSEEELEIEIPFDDDCEVVSHYYRAKRLQNHSILSSG